VGGAIGAVFISIDPTFAAYNSYTRTKSTYFTSLFDYDFNHVDGEIQKNVFNKISDFTEGKDPMIESIFRYGNDFIYGYFDKREKNYNLVKFND
jgi:hypothetical protein